MTLNNETKFQDIENGITFILKNQFYEIFICDSMVGFNI